MVTTLHEEFMESIGKFVKELGSTGDTVGAEILIEQAVSGDSIPKSHLDKISKLVRGEVDPASIYTFPVLMIDTAPTRNYVIYTEKSQKKSIKSWVGTTYLFNESGTMPLFSGSGDHTLQAASQVARIYDARCVMTPKNGVGSLAWVYSVMGSKRTDEFIHLVNSGILREVSIHVQVPDGVICSIDNDAFSKCYEKNKTDHFPGEKYGKQTCYMSTGEGLLIPLELSQVACPGSISAHIMQDGEVDNYPIVSLREALGGSQEVIETIRQQETEMLNETDARAKLTEIAAAAGVTLAEAVIDPANKEFTDVANIDAWEEAKKKADPPEEPDADDEPTKNAAKCAECGHAEHGTADCSVNGCECHGSQSAQPKAALFEGHCPVCLRDGTEIAPPANETEATKQLREQFQASVGEVVEKANTKISTAEIERDSFKTKAEERDVLFTEYVEMVVQGAIDKGQKLETERAGYRESLLGLSFQAVRAVREALGTAIKPTPEVRREALVTSMKDRAKIEIGTTTVETDVTTGRKRASTARRGGFAAR